MTTPAQRAWLEHGTAAALAACCLVVLAPWKAGHDPFMTSVDPGLTRLDYPLHDYLDTYRTQPFFAAALGKALDDGSSIVLLGSSELTTADHPSKPIRFFNEELGVPLMAIGHDGNQSFSMHAQLIVADADLARARIAVMISPGWFVGSSGRRGTALAAFLEYQPSPSLYRLHRMLVNKDPDARVLGRYLSEHEHELDMTQPITLWITRASSSTGSWLYAYSQPWNALIIDATSDAMLRSPDLRTWSIPERHDLGPSDWQVRYADGIREHLAHCTNNRVFVNDEFYAEHVNGNTRELEALPFDENRELRDFIGLLDFLKAGHARPFFVLQPLNPYVYSGLKEVRPTIDAIRRELDDHGFGYLDLWVNDTTEFQPGTLTDVMHLGPLGWYRVDSAIAAYFP